MKEGQAKQGVLTFPEAHAFPVTQSLDENAPSPIAYPFLYVHVCGWVCVCLCAYVCVCARLYASLDVRMYTYVHMSVYIYA
jgi:hypothetical protein